MEKFTKGKCKVIKTGGFDYGSSIFWVNGLKDSCVHSDHECVAQLIAAAGAAASKLAEQYPNLDIVKLFENLPELIENLDAQWFDDAFDLLLNCERGE